jgi:glycosyltransferase involved in cell wall biosynthesis
MLRATGGEYQYSLTMLDGLVRLREAVAPGVTFTSDPDATDLQRARQAGWRTGSLDPSGSKRTSRRMVDKLPFRDWFWDLRRAARLRRYCGATVVDPKPNDALRRHITAAGVDLLVYPSPMATSFESGIPYVMVIHDLQHRLQPEFPEVSAGGEYEWREYLYRNGTQNAALLVADSEVGREDILNNYGDLGVTEDRVRVLPFLPAPYIHPQPDASERERVRQRYSLPERYLFYPAQFWPHKNHKRLVEAQGRLRDVHIVFSGSAADRMRRETLQGVVRTVERLGLGDRVHFIGYAPAEDMSALYAESVALVFPTFFGPTNIPIIEAWAMGCPVVTSDIRGVREQAGDAALLTDPRSIEALADAMNRIWHDRQLRNELTKRGRIRLSLYTETDYDARLRDILLEAIGLAGCDAGSSGCANGEVPWT